jgi:hypothetical protein
VLVALPRYVKSVASPAYPVLVAQWSLMKHEFASTICGAGVNV